VNLANKFEATPLELAVLSKDTAIAKILLEAGADPQVEVSGLDAQLTGRSIVDFARDSGDAALAQLLSDYNEKWRSKRVGAVVEDEKWARMNTVERLMCATLTFTSL
jgi:ankyrin repeat protein